MDTYRTPARFPGFEWVLYQEHTFTGFLPLQIEILDSQSSSLFSNEPFQKKPVMTIEDLVLHSDDHFKYHLLVNGQYSQSHLGWHFRKLKAQKARTSLLPRFSEKSHSCLWALSFELWNRIVPRRSEDPLLLVPLVPPRSEDPLLLVPLVPRTLTCPNLSHLGPIWVNHLSFPNSLFSDFFLGFSLPFHVSKNTFEWKVCFKILSC